MEGDPCAARRGSGRAARVARRERGQSGDLGGRQVAVPRLRVQRRRRGARCRFRWAAATDPLDEHTLAAVAAGVSNGGMRVRWTRRRPRWRSGGRRAARCLGGSPALSAKRLRSFLSRPGRAGPACGLHRRQGLPGPLHGGALGIDTQGRKHVLGLREGATETAVVTTACSAIWSRAACRRTDVAVRHRRRAGAAPGHHRCLRFPRGGATVPSTQAAQRARPSARTAAHPKTSTLRSARRCGMPGTSSQRTVRRGC